ncbi:Trans-aconitate decarboxylase 1 [Fulvia fulva]|uniref:Trans-aconitate decarboxylase 1 n=1 Tax=Passalora fulva TaxID=5499 RepID=A0A9Q8P6F6_PASFU|nr:Trans-aconitate decarboxylase 1 [Fulvia fulva]KAK4629265.1 Trans-aconitate decarboxylase 1 [Fulvia fulva]KAK4630557.1 Trans-aconitate decarboxylase 1 [Fulvia fulva]UJO14777.1 Trans-aconitate decarboxylase 1 [Fulvia fulva]WPV13051.1 Trans-aconitate decarboxylase 1 [Fulvia fulva]WPV27392.1 Trans-aconitate decarboxylase 1 [Fulvia fulva]
MPVSAIDSLLFKNLFGTEDVRKIFDDKKYIDYCVLVEKNLADAQAFYELIPHDAAKEILFQCGKNLDYDKLSQETEVVGYPILPLVTQLAKECGEEAGKYVHWGATTQDIQDTATMMQMRDALILVEARLKAIIKSLSSLAETYKDAPMAGRTHLQHALPVTFGYKCAVYLSSFQRHLERLEQLRPRCLLVQFGGAAGTLASLGPDTERSLQVRARLARQLGLEDPPITWHTARDGIAEMINFLALIGGTLGKVATDLIIMSSNEFSEVSEPFILHRGASSTMPQKRNPISSEVILAASKMLRANAGLCLDAMLTDFERASGPWQLEWAAVPESCVLVVGALSQAEFALSGLVVNVDATRKNLDSTKGLIVAEAVMMEVARTIGRQRAHEVGYEACRETIESSDRERTLLATLLEKVEVTEAVDRERLEELCQTKNYLGAAGAMVDAVLALNNTGLEAARLGIFT